MYAVPRRPDCDKTSVEREDDDDDEEEEEVLQEGKETGWSSRA